MTLERRGGRVSVLWIEWLLAILIRLPELKAHCMGIPTPDTQLMHICFYQLAIQPVFRLSY